MKSEKFIRERNSSFQVRLKYYDDDGIRHEYSKSFKFADYNTKNECKKSAIRHRDEMLYRLDADGIIKRQDKTLQEVYDESKELFPQSTETIRKHDIVFRQSLERYGNKLIKDITPKDITVTLNEVRNKSQASIGRVFSAWKLVYKTALVSNYVTQDPTLRVTVPTSEKISTPKSVIMECSLEDVLKALADFGTTESRAYDCQLLSFALIIMAYLGLRPAECYALTKDDFDLEKKTVSITKSVGSTHTEELTIRKTKTATSVRVLPLPDELLPVIGNLFSFQKDNALFVFYDGTIANSRKATSIISGACRKANIKFNPYMLRHAFSTNLIQAGCDIRTIMELMGHSNTSMTIDYARSNDDIKREVISKVGDKIGDKK